MFVVLFFIALCFFVLCSDVAKSLAAVSRCWPHGAGHAYLLLSHSPNGAGFNAQMIDFRARAESGQMRGESAR